MWQFFAALNGYVDANTPKDGNKLSEGEADDLFDWLERDTVAGVLSTMTYWLDGDRLVPWRGVEFTAE
jgi:hypothetical protein